MLRSVGVLLLLPAILAPQQPAGEIRGSILGAGPDLLHIARVELRNGELRRLAETGTGTFDFRPLPPGVYDLRISMPFYLDTIIRSVPIKPGEVRALPPVAPMFEGMNGGCGRRIPAFLRPLDEPDATKGSLEGRIIDDNGHPLAGARVRLAISNVDIPGATVTDSSGRFSLPDVPARSRYEIEVAHEGFFTEDFSDFAVQAGYESFYDRIDLFPCEKGHCEPALRPIRILPVCE